MLGRGLRFVQWRRIRNPIKPQEPACAWTHAIANISPQAIALNLSCSGQAHFRRPSIGYGYESTEPECILTVLRVPSMILLFHGSAGA